MGGIGIYLGLLDPSLPLSNISLGKATSKVTGWCVHVTPEGVLIDEQDVLLTTLPRS